MQLSPSAQQVRCMFVGKICPASWPCRLQLQQGMVLQAQQHLMHYMKYSWLRPPHALQGVGPAAQTTNALC